MDVLNRVRRWRPSWPGLAWLVPTALGGALRFYHAASLSGVWTPHLDRGEGYYEGAINFLGYRVLAERVPSFIPLGTRGPLYQAFIVAVESLFSSPHPGHVILAQAALSTLAIAAVYELGSELASPWAGLLAALWMALDFGQIELVGRLDLAVFYQLAILALAAALIGWAKAPSRKRTVLLAATLASTLICRSAHYAFPFLLAAGCLTLPRWKDARRALPLLAAATGLFLGVAVATNSARFGRLMPLDAETGSVRFYAATVGEPCCSEGQTERYRAAATDGGRSAEGASSAEGAILSRGFRNIRERPLVFARSFARNAAAFWRPFAAALILGLAAAFTHGLEPGFQALLLTLLSFLGYHVLVVYPWHSSVVMPLLAVLAGLGLGSAHRLLGKKHLSADFFCRPRDAGWARGALVCVFAGLYAVVLALFAAERLSAGTHRIADALGDPSASAHRAPLALLDLSVASSRGRYGLEERSNVLAAMGLYARACADLASLARLDPSSVALARRARLCASESALGQEGLVLIKSMARSPAGRREMTTDLRLATPCDWPQWGRPDSIGRAFLDRCVLASPRNPFSRENRGVSRYLAGDKKGAAEDFRAAVRADPDFAQAFLSLSTVLFELGRAKDALAAAERALALAARSRDPALRAAALDSVASVRRALKLPPLVIDDAQTPARVAQAPPAAGAVSASVRKVPISAAALPALKSAPSEAAALREAELAHYAAAEAIFQALIRKSPREPRLRLLLATVWARAGDRAATLSALGEARALGPNAVDRQRMAFLYQDLKDYGPARELLDDLLARSPKDLSLRLDRASLAAQTGDAPEGLAQLTAARALNPAPADRRRMASLYRDLREFERARAQLEELVKESPGDAGLRLDLASLAARADNRAAALESLAAARERGPSLEERRRIASLYLELRQDSDAGAVLEGLVRDQPKEPWHFIELAAVDYRRGRHESALASLVKARGLGPDLQQRQRMALVYEDLGERATARRMIDALIAEQPQDPQLRLARAYFAADAGDVRASRAFIEETLARSPDPDDLRRIKLLNERLDQPQP